MNIADRSLALVDFALRRRFAFVKLEPTFNNRWIEWVNQKNKIQKEMLSDIKRKMENLNTMISSDPALGPQFVIGHSFVTPSSISQIDDPIIWFKNVVETEIIPLLEEYWFDSFDKVEKASDLLLEKLK